MVYILISLEILYTPLFHVTSGVLPAD